MANNSGPRIWGIRQGIIIHYSNFYCVTKWLTYLQETCWCTHSNMQSSVTKQQTSAPRAVYPQLANEALLEVCQGAHCQALRQCFLLTE